MNFISNSPKHISSLLRSWMLAVLTVITFSACATRPRLVDHSFEFDARWDSPDVEILDYRYGASNQPGAKGCQKQDTPCLASRQYVGITGEMLLGDDLFVKWRVKSTGIVYEDTVDLRGRLPSDMKKHKLRFVVKGAQLYVFVISAEKSESNSCPSKDQLCRIADSSCPSAYDRVLSMYCHKKFIQIYPDQPASQQSR